jgi:hypothetical protein
MILLAKQIKDWHEIVTLPTSSFYYNADHELISLPPDGKVPDRERVTVHSKKAMLAILWDPTRFTIVTALESGCRFNAGYYMTKVLTALSEWWRERGGGNFGKLIVDDNHALPHKATVSQQFVDRNEMVLAAHPPYSPEMAPSDFYIFGHVESLPRGESLGTGQRLLSAVEGIFETKRIVWQFRSTDLAERGALAQFVLAIRAAARALTRNLLFFVSYKLR